MNKKAKKYRFIKSLDKVSEQTIEKLEFILKQETANSNKVSKIHQNILDKRITSLQQNPSNLVDWDDVKDNW